MKPQFSWISDSSDPDVKSGVARWNSGPENLAKIRFSTFDEAFLMNKVVETAYWGGRRDGQKQVARLVEDTIEPFLD